MDFEHFWRTASTGEQLGTNIKYNLCHQAFISRIKHVESWVKSPQWPAQRPQNLSTQSSCTKSNNLPGRRRVCCSGNRLIARQVRGVVLVGH